MIEAQPLTAVQRPTPATAAATAKTGNVLLEWTKPADASEPRGDLTGVALNDRGTIR